MGNLFEKDYCLTTAEIYYHMPDHPQLLQSFIWQQYDVAPKFPALKKFLNFWEHEIDGKLHSVKVTNLELSTINDFRFARGEFLLH